MGEMKEGVYTHITANGYKPKNFKGCCSLKGKTTSARADELHC